jgi:aminomuconate-semialdehyde/2-hydroxymuconate-6-semialdehyde dehydrogenase
MRIQNFIGGQLVPPANGQYLDNYNPADGSVSGQIPDSDARDVDAAVQAAKKAFRDWATWPAERRCAVLMAISEGILNRLEELAAAESADSGKTIGTASSIDIPRAALNFKFFATACLHVASESHWQAGGSLSYTLRQPLGVVGCISPWNLPLYLLTWKIAPALATGNCVVAKPSEVTPVTAYLLADICRGAGLPDGVLNIVHGRGTQAGSAIVAHPDVKAISFTGSTRAGAEIARVAAPMFKKLSLELGGKNPNLIFADCDYDTMLDTTVRSSFNNQGQICLCGSRIYVERTLYSRFLADFKARVAALKVGHPSAPDSQLGAVVSAAHFHKIMGYLDLAQQEGGTLETGGHALQVTPGGWYIAPTVISGLGAQARCNQEEIFGPVVTVQAFDSEAEALELANSTHYGLSATLWTNQWPRIQRLTQSLEAGVVWVNTWMLRDLRTPFGGVKQSGIGREGGWEAMRFFTEAKNVTFPPASN